MKKSVIIGIIFLLCVSIVSAGFFNNLLGMVTGVGTCKDTDSLDTVTKGKVVWTTTAGTKTKVDSCIDATSVAEWHCTGENLGRPLQIPCNTGTTCIDGACIPSNEENSVEESIPETTTTTTNTCGDGTCTGTETCEWDGVTGLQKLCNGARLSSNQFCTNCVLTTRATCGNSICEEGEASTAGGCGPDADPRCIGPPAQAGTCPQDCPTQTPPPTGNLPCADSDGGLNYRVHGVTVSQTSVRRDVCNPSGQLEEYSCAADASIAMALIDCPTQDPSFICVTNRNGGGFCGVPVETDLYTCLDKDGVDPLVKNQIAWLGDNDTIKYKTDSCHSDGKSVAEWYCPNNIMKGRPRTAYCADNYICVDGACVKQIQPNNCDTNMNCFIQASQSCSASLVTTTSTIAMTAGVTQITTSQNMIKGLENGKCVFYFKTEQITLKFPSGTSQSVIDQQNAIYDALEGSENTCKFNTADLTAMLNRWNQGIFSSHDWDVAECTGAYFN